MTKRTKIMIRENDRAKFHLNRFRKFQNIIGTELKDDRFKKTVFKV